MRQKYFLGSLWRRDVSKLLTAPDTHQQRLGVCDPEFYILPFLHILPFGCVALVTHPLCLETPSPPHQQLCFYHTPSQLSSCHSRFRVSSLPTHSPLHLSIPFSSESPHSAETPAGNQQSQTLLVDSRCSSPPPGFSLCLSVLGRFAPLQAGLLSHPTLPLQLQ